MNNPLITTIIPTYRRPELLRRAIESVLIQSFENFRLCVYDNASGDETEEIVTRYASQDSRVKYFKNERNIGPVLNMKKGVAAVNTPFYSLLNDDDFLLPDFYQSVVSAIKRYPEAGFICAKAITIDLTKNSFTHRNKEWSAGLYVPSSKVIEKIYGSHFTQTGVVLSTKVRDEVGFFEPSGDDCLYQVMASSYVPFVVLDYYGAVYTLHDEAFSIAEGLRNNDVEEITAQFVETLKVCMNMEVQPDLKSYAALIITKSYTKSFDRIALKYCSNNNFQSIHRMPSLLTNPSLVRKIYEMCHPRVYAGISLIVNVAKISRKIRQRIIGAGTTGNSNDLTVSAIKYFKDKSTDIKSIERTLL